MTNVNSTIHINKPAAEVFAFIANPENNPQWQNGMVSCEITSAGPLGIGSTYAQHARFMGRDIVSQFEITRYEPGRLIRGDTVESSFPISFTRIVEPDEDGTGSHVRAIVTGDASGFYGALLRPLTPLMNWMVGRSVRADYRRLKALLDQ